MSTMGLAVIYDMIADKSSVSSGMPATGFSSASSTTSPSIRRGICHAYVVQHRSSSNDNTDAFRVHSHFTVEALKPKRNKN